MARACRWPWRAGALVALVACLATPAWAGEKIQPGMSVSLEGGAGPCTANFVYDGLGPVAGRTYIGLASHCFAEHDTRVVVDREDVPFGRIVHRNWPLDSVADDWALIEIFPGRLGDVDPSLRGDPEFPTGVAGEEDVKQGDEVRISGYGAGMLRDELRTGRSGFITGWGAVYYELIGPISIGDSGGGLAHVPSGKALGIVSAGCTPDNWGTDAYVPVGCAWFGPTVAEAMRRMAKAGYPVRMRSAGAPAPAAPVVSSAPAPPAQAAQPSPPPTTQTKPAAPKKKKKERSARCKTRKQKRGRACRRARGRRP